MLPHTGLFLLGKVALQMRIRRRLKGSFRRLSIFMATAIFPNQQGSMRRYAAFFDQKDYN